MLYQSTYNQAITKAHRTDRTKGAYNMYEVVKVVKGYEIKRLKGSRGMYHVTVREGNGWREYHRFRTIKSAVEYIEKYL